MKTKIDTYQKITDKIIDQMEKGVCPWRRPWSTCNILPQNYTNKRQYAGINFMLLHSVGYQVPMFLTFNQAKELGGQVRKGEHGMPVVYWSIFKSKDKFDANGKPQEIPFLKHFTVFNVSQIDGIEFDLPKIEKFDFNPIERAESIVSNWKECPKIEHDKGKACYSPISDVVKMPAKETFFRAEGYYSTLFHELAHSTGHKSRLNRCILGLKGSNAYAKEELIAEMTSAFICANCGIDNDVIDNQSAYLQSWIDCLRGDSKLIVQAAGKAQKAANMILGIEQVKESEIAA